jgi:hypothetical protein
MSVPLPADVGTTSSIDFDGNVWATAVPARPAANTLPTRSFNMLRVIAMRVFSLGCLADMPVVLPALGFQ